MKRVFLNCNIILFNKAVVLCLFVLVFEHTFAASDDDNARKLHSFPEWFHDSPFLDLQEAMADGVEQNKRGIMLLFTTQGCSYCEQFIRISLGDPKIAALVQDRFISLGLEIFDDREMITPTGEAVVVKEFAKKEGVGFAPTLLFYDESGRRVLRQVGYQAPQRFEHLIEYVAGKQYSHQSLRAFIESKQSIVANVESYPKLRDDTLFDTPPYVLDRSHFDASQPLMVLFEKKGCGECETFHQDVMRLKVVRDTLDKFQVVRMDVDDDSTPVLLPSGERSTPSQWYQQTTFSRLPALMFVNEKGAQALSTDALVQEGRMMNSLNYMLEKAYLKNWTYQQFARSKAIARSQESPIAIK